MEKGDDSSDSSEVTVSSSSSDGTYTPKTSSSEDDSEDAFTDHTEEFDYDEVTKTYSVKDWPDEVWQEHYVKVFHDPLETCYEMDDDKEDCWSITDMPSNDDPIIVAHIQACLENQKFAYGNEQYTSAKHVSGDSERLEREDRRLKTTFSISAKHYHGVPPGKRTSTNPRVYVSAMQFGNLSHVAEVEAMVLLSPGMLVYVEGEGWCIVQNINAYNGGERR